MKRIAAFLVAFALFLVSVAGFHVYTRNGITMNNKEFGTWVNIYKDMSRDAIANNLGKNTMLVMGSSEFQHGRKTPFHPRYVFKNSNRDLMLVGAPYTQCLFHTTLLGGVENAMPKRDVILLLSPSWFKAEGIRGNGFAARFSESEYIAFMSNKKISKDIKMRVMQSTYSKLGNFPDMRSRVLRYDNVLMSENAHIDDKLYVLGRRDFLRERDHVNVMTALKTTNIKKNGNKKQKETRYGAINWDGLMKKAELADREKSQNNAFYMKDKFYNRKIAPVMKIKKDSYVYVNCTEVPEYYDLETFLMLCKERGIHAHIVLLPVNGYWYDYTGLTEDERDQLSRQVGALITSYGQSFYDMSNYSYEPYFFEDAVHPAGKGWLTIDEQIDKIYRENF